ncbi:MAG: glycosyltransferase family 1 protein [Sphingobacteriales bacterium]|nr:MAG: glycosyltransferase family 1 protein [Sphingobacteriales bacterium]
MKVAYISRSTLYTSAGGDTTQLDETAANLREMGVEVDVYLSHEQIDYNKYDLLHFFNIIRPADILKHARLSRKPYLISTIFVEYGNVQEKLSGLKGLVQKLVSDERLEYIKAIARWVKNGERIVSKEYLLLGHRKAILKAANGASMLLPNSESEYKRLVKKYAITTPYRVVPNGIDIKMTGKQYPANEKYKDAVLCMGRVETRKNQLRLIKALNNTMYRLFLYGKASPNNMAYYEACKTAAAGNVHMDGWIAGDDLYTAYSNAKVHVLPSYFETTGLSSLEAAVMGCNIVVTNKGDTRDYFKDDAWYCDPDSERSIKEAVDAAYAAPYNEAFKQRILKDYTWKRAAEETLAAYKQVLKV